MNQIEQVPWREWEGWADDNDAVVLDVREPEEWEQGTLPGATRISITEIMDRIDEIPTDRAILCVSVEVVEGANRSRPISRSTGTSTSPTWLVGCTPSDSRTDRGNRDCPHRGSW